MSSKEFLYSVLHKKCGGEIVLVSDGVSCDLACKQCMQGWIIGKMMPKLSKSEFELYKPSDSETPQYQCQSYYGDNNELQGCTCGKCADAKG